MKTVSIANIGPIEHLEMPLPQDGGFVVLKGTHGTGKTTTLRAVDTLLQGEGSLCKRDGALEGRIEGFGATISVKKVQRRSGSAELEVDSLAGRFSLADLVDPHIKDQLAADAHRIKALVQLAGVKPDITLFQGLIDDPKEFSRIVGSPKTDDVVSLAKRVKENIELAARSEEKSASTASGSESAHRAAAGELSDEPELDIATLHAELEDAIRDEAKLRADADNGKEIKRRAAEAQEWLDDAKTAYDGLSSEDAEIAFDAARKAEHEAAELMRKAEESVRNAKAQRDRAETELKEAKRHAENILAWQRSISEASDVNVPSESDIENAAKDVQRCRETIELANARKTAKEHLTKAEEFKSLRVGHERLAAVYRQAAAKVDSVLTNAVGTLDCPLRVKEGRLVLTTDRGDEHFADLSDGERWALAFDIAIPLIPGNGLLTMPQSAYGELAPATRRQLHEKLKEKRVVCITAQVTDDETLVAESFDEQ